MPTSIRDLQTDWQRNYSTHTNAYQSGRSSFIPHLLPQTAVQLSVYQTLELLLNRLGNDVLRRALDPREIIDSPARTFADSTWLKTSNMVGINVRTIGSFWKVVNYSLTLPALHDSIHLLPIWEPGVVGSLYGMVSWQINPEFFDVELARYVPALNTVEKQLNVVINLLHALGRTVGMDVIPHTDRFSEMVLTHPALFEWVYRRPPFRRSESTDPLADETEPVTPSPDESEDAAPVESIQEDDFDHSSYVYRHVEETIWQFLKSHGSADGTQLRFGKDAFFSADEALLTDEQRSRILFGPAGDYGKRLQKRVDLIRHLTALGFETLPMTMAPPYRGLHIDSSDFVIDEYGQTWYQYVFDRPQAMSRVFGPLARYRFYESKDNNQTWELDFDRPNCAAWDYLCRSVHDCQRTYNFDFMRGDMAHVQMRPGGVPTGNPDEYYDPLRAVKRYVQANGTPHFGFFAETFLAPPDTMSYGDELDHLDAIDADSTLGDLQSSVVESAEFVQRFRDYYGYLRTRRFAPNFTVMTADKDDPRFDEFYRTGNLFRYFTALFLTDMPSYVGLGFEVRNLHLTRGANEEYTKLYVFDIGDDRQTDKVTHGPFVWGENAEQFAAIGRMRTFAESIWPAIRGKETRWLVAPGVDAPGEADYVAWTHVEFTSFTFAAGLVGTLPETVPGAVGEVVFEEGECRIWRSEPA